MSPGAAMGRDGAPARRIATEREYPERLRESKAEPKLDAEPPAS